MFAALEIRCHFCLVPMAIDTSSHRGRAYEIWNTTHSSPESDPRAGRFRLSTAVHVKYCYSFSIREISGRRNPRVEVSMLVWHCPVERARYTHFVYKDYFNIMRWSRMLHIIPYSDHTIEARFVQRLVIGFGKMGEVVAALLACFPRWHPDPDQTHPRKPADSSGIIISLIIVAPSRCVFSAHKAFDIQFLTFDI